MNKAKDVADLSSSDNINNRPKRIFDKVQNKGSLNIVEYDDEIKQIAAKIVEASSVTKSIDDIPQLSNFMYPGLVTPAMLKHVYAR